MKAANQSTSFKRLFEPLKIKKLTLRNRIVFPGVATAYATPDGFVSKGLISFHEARAEHVGLSVVELTLPRPGGGVCIHNLHVYDDKYIPGLSKLAQAIKRKGAVAILQLADIGARAGTLGAAADPIAPSRITFGPKEARELSIGEIEKLVIDFAEAARRAFQAGFDGVEIHAAHLYLISEFLSPFANKRTDKYGGSIENRARFLLEIIKATRERVPADFIIQCRTNMFEPIANGVQIEDVRKVGQLIEKAGVDIWSLSGTCQALRVKHGDREYDWFTAVCPQDWPEGNEIKYVSQVRDAVKIPVITVGKIFSPQLAENILELKQADMVAMARALIADPELPRKVFEGRDREINRCREQFHCLKSLGEHKVLSCEVNKSLPPKDIDVPA